MIIRLYSVRTISPTNFLWFFNPFWYVHFYPVLVYFLLLRFCNPAFHLICAFLSYYCIFVCNPAFQRSPWRMFLKKFSWLICQINYNKKITAPCYKKKSHFFCCKKNIIEDISYQSTKSCSIQHNKIINFPLAQPHTLSVLVNEVVYDNV